MEFAVKRFARNILLLHLGLLVVVLGVVYFASRAIRQSAREQALQQAQSRQEQLARQTARGIEEFYGSILSDLDLLPPADNSADERVLLNGLTGSRLRARNQPIFQRRNSLGPLLARQLEERIEYLFVFDKNRQSADEIQPDATPTTRPTIRNERLVIRAFEPWLKSIQEASISPFAVVDGKGINLVCHPLPRISSVIVAVVAVDKINQEYLTPLNDDRATGAFLFNDELTVMGASRSDLIGANVARNLDPQVLDAIAKFRASPTPRPPVEQGDAVPPAAAPTPANLAPPPVESRVLSNPFEIGQDSFAPAVVTAVPIQLPGKRWVVLVSSPLGEVDSVVARLFHKIVIWAFFVVIAVTAILVSTAVQMIRGRVKLERVRHEMLRRELERARQIQQAWLPRSAPSCQWLDISAVNYPAQHISGDFYNWFDLPNGRTGVVIGDVTGHGMSAAFLMATTQLLVRTTLLRIRDPGACMVEVNRQLCTLVFNGQFVTMQILVIDPGRRSIELATAGHPAPLLAEKSAPGGGGSAEAPVFRSLKIEPQLVLGVDADETYATERFELPIDATLLLYTDGAADVQAPDGRRLGEAGLCRSIPHASDPGGADAKAVLEAIVSGVDRFRSGANLGDDLTLVALRLHGIPRSAAKRPTASAVMAPSA